MALHVTEPKWVKVTISAELVPTSLQEAEVIRERAISAVTRFLHPLTGGTTGQGWNFGRYPHQSDMYAVLGKVEGVDHINDLQISPANIDSSLKQFLIYSGTHSINLDLS
jgi:hypothetical protein